MPRGKPDFILFFLTFALCGFGLVMIFSSSVMSASLKFHNPFYFAERQSFWFLFGLLAMFICMNIPFFRFKKWYPFFFLSAIIMLVLVLVIGTNIKGHKSWFSFGSVGIQPTEWAKLALIIYLAALINKKGEKFHYFKKGLLPILLVITFIIGLIMLQPDIGSTLVVLICSLCMMIVGGVNLIHLSLISTAVSPIAFWIVTAKSYRMERFTAFLHPWDDPGGTSYQLVHSLYALGHGGWFGAGFGRGIEKLSYLPEAHTDFIFSVICEEFGWIGSTLFLLTFILLLWRGILAGLRCSDRFGTLLAIGITSSIGVQSLINLGGVTGSIPITGVPLPLISYGGSSLLLSMASIGILLSITRSNHLEIIHSKTTGDVQHTS